MSSWGSWSQSVFGGAYVGSKFALNMDESLLRRSFAVLLVLVALQLFFKK